MDIAAFQSIYPEDVRIQQGRVGWIGEDLQFYDAKNDCWSNMIESDQALMFQDKFLTFKKIDGLIKSSIVGQKEFAIIVDNGLIGFVRGLNLKTENEEDMDIEIDWDSKSQFESKHFETLDLFSSEEELKNLM